jgi:hypothetical protein
MSQIKRSYAYDETEGDDVVKDGECLRVPLMLCDGMDHRSLVAERRQAVSDGVPKQPPPARRARSEIAGRDAPF